MKVHYIWTVVVLVLLGFVLVFAVLYLRPGCDPLDVIAEVAKVLAPTIAGVLAYLKSQETHLTVNGRLSAMLDAHAQVARSEGVAQGIVIEATRAKALAATAPTESAVVPPPPGPPAQL